MTADQSVGWDVWVRGVLFSALARSQFHFHLKRKREVTGCCCAWGDSVMSRL